MKEIKQDYHLKSKNSLKRDDTEKYHLNIV